MARKEQPTENVAVQQKSIDDAPAAALAAHQANSQKETTMNDKQLFSHMQQAGNDWLKLMTDSAARFTASLGEVQKLEQQGVAKAISAVDEASRVAKEAINLTEQLSAQWRKAVTDYAQRTLDLVSPKN